MIEVGREFGIEQDATAYDLTSDEVIGRALVRKVLAQVHALALERDSEFSDFATSFRTMNREDRAEWLHRAALAASNADGGHPRRAARTESRGRPDLARRDSPPTPRRRRSSYGHHDGGRRGDGRRGRCGERRGDVIGHQDHEGLSCNPWPGS